MEQETLESVIHEEAKETVLGFSQGAVEVL